MIYSFFFTILVLSDPVVSDNDILMTKQVYGQCHRDLSVEGHPLTIAGVTFSTGIGTHATSMIPITVPEGATSLSGACGIDDEITGDSATVIFRVLSGSEVLWYSKVMQKGDSASKFTVEVPKGSKKLYLFADEYDTKDFDHADWVDLKWGYDKVMKKSKKNRHTILKKNTFDDQGPALRKKISECRSSSEKLIVLEKGEYHFYLAGALTMSFHVSNHDQPTFQPIAIPLVDLHDFVLDCSGSTFYFHDLMEPFLILDSSNVTVKNVIIDYWRPYYTEGVVTSADYFTTSFHINTTLFPFHVEMLTFVFEHEGFNLGVNSMTLFEKESGHILANTGDVNYVAIATGGSDGYTTITQNLKRYGLKEGDVVVFRTWDRPHPSIVIYRSNDTTLNNVHIYSSQGMAIIGQRSDTIHIINSGVECGFGRYYSSSADATHFSNCKGQIVVENTIFEGMMDDAINVHSTSLKIIEVVNNSCVKLQYVHSQSVGFETFLPGEKIQFIRSKTLENDEIRVVMSAEKLSTNELLVVFEGSIPSSIGVGDAVENGDFYPSVVFRNNGVKNNRARGCLFTTPKDVLVENNDFDYTSGSAVLFAGDAANWYESGSCQKVVIRNNTITNALTSTYQFTNAIFSFNPTIADVKGQSKFYHRNVIIEGNTIITFNVPLLYGMSSENVVFRNNVINYNDDFGSWNQKPFQFNKVKNITINENRVTPEKIFSIDDVKLENTDKSEIHIN